MRLVRLFDSLPPWVQNNLTWMVGAAIVLLGLGVFGLGDVLRFRLRRVWAISSVCFAESIRRRVLWLIPLAILGLVAIVQLQRPFDDQDAIRQTTKFCLLTSGLVVVVTTVILACTNLPREIENKVIFTVVTKPTTRLEVVLGKIVGFSRLSATILVIMGLFSYGYLHLRASLFERELRQRLDAGLVEPVAQATSRHYVDNHLLNARELVYADAFNIYGALPDAKSTRRYPTPDGTILVPFTLPDNATALADPEGDTIKLPGFSGNIRVGYDTLPGVKLDHEKDSKPTVSVQVLDANRTLSIGDIINKGAAFPVESPDGKSEIKFSIPPQAAASVAKPDQEARLKGSHRRVPFWVAVIPRSSENYRVWIDVVPNDPPVRLVIPLVPEAGATSISTMVAGPQPTTDGSDPIQFTGREGQLGQQIKGDSPQVGIFRFAGTPVRPDDRGNAQFEFRIGIEKNSETGDRDSLTRAALTFVDPATGHRSEPVLVTPENNRPSYGSVKVDAVGNGRFDVEVKCLSENQWLNVSGGSLQIVRAESPFGLNLFMSLLILWLLSVLVTSTSVFCSTFVSWPIAVMLTLVILLTRWVLGELGDAAAAGLGRSIMQEFGVSDPTVSQSLSNVVELLNKTTSKIGLILPDITQFSATEQIEKGMIVTSAAVGSALLVTAEFGLPLAVLAYLIFRRKEVAP